MKEIKRVVILGANGAMGSGSAALFASRGFDVVLLARTADKAAEGQTQALKVVRSAALADHMTCASYGPELEEHVSRADLVVEALAEDLGLKQAFFTRVDAARAPHAVVATVSSGLSMAAMCKGRSPAFGRHFMGIHLFNPPHVIVGTEMIPGPDTDRELFQAMAAFMTRRLGRVVVLCRDLPAFAGNRIGFELLNQCAQLALEHGVERVDALIGPYTGRALPPLATLDLVGWDVHRAIVDNVYAHTQDECHSHFALPHYMAQLIGHGHLGNKTPQLGGFFRTAKAQGGPAEQLALDPKTMTYRPAQPVAVPPFVAEMKALHQVGQYREAMRLLLSAQGSEADLVRQVILGYVSYALHRVGPQEVVDRPVDVDLIMGYGFNWAPPSALVDLWGAEETRTALSKTGIPIPPVLADLPPGERLFRHPQTQVGRFFVAKG
jgi:3-hydroxyacyl-CoA dehydrogenase